MDTATTARCITRLQNVITVAQAIDHTRLDSGELGPIGLDVAMDGIAAITESVILEMGDPEPTMQSALRDLAAAARTVLQLDTRAIQTGDGIVLSSSVFNAVGSLLAAIDKR